MFWVSDHLERKMNKKIWLLLTLLVMVACASTGEKKQSLVRPYLSKESVRGVWIGFDQDSAFFYRLVLEPNSKGSCMVMCEDEFSGAYQIAGWELNKRTISLKVVPWTAASEKIVLEVYFIDEGEMRIRSRGQERTWSHDLILHREDRILENIRKCKALDTQRRPTGVN